MKNQQLLVLSLLAVGLSACAAQQPSGDGSKVEGSLVQVALAPFPYTTEQIHGATKVGRTYLWRIEAPDHPTVQRRMRFTAVSEERCSTEAQILDLDGNAVGPAELHEATWMELRDHASAPKASTTITDEIVEVPAGKFSCLHYTVVDEKDGVRTTTTMDFAKDLPGAPVKMRIEANGTPVMTMTLLQHTPGN